MTVMCCSMNYQTAKNNKIEHEDLVTCLAIETSCDETGVAIVLKRKGEDPKVITSLVASQIDIHTLTGGVVPEVAAREHASVVTPLLEEALKQSGLTANDISSIAVTVAPGLMPALAVGVTAARTLSYAWDKPIVPIHHLEGHIYSALLSLDENSTTNASELFPALALVVSGGHTMLVLVQDHLQYQVIGTTRDDAAGEAFDKVARLLRLSYPGGPSVSAAATSGDSSAFDFPRPMVNTNDLAFSFSGLKTAVLYTLREHNNDTRWLEQNRDDIAASFQEAVIDTLARKTSQALMRYPVKTLLLAGGVAANSSLRVRLQEVARKNGVSLRVAPAKLCGDNAAMIGQIGTIAQERSRLITWKDVDATARQSIEDFSVLERH